MTLHDFLEKYYLPSGKTEIVKLLNEISAYKTVEYAINEFYISIEKQNRNNILSQLVLTINGYTEAINNGLQIISNKELKINNERKILELSIYLIKETYQLSTLPRLEYFEILKETVEKTYKKHSWDFLILDSLLNLENIKNYSEEIVEIKKDKIKLSKPIQIEWNSNFPLDFFIDDVVNTFSGIKTKATLFKLFDKIDDDFEIHLNSKYLVTFLSLFYELHQCKTISIIGNRGLFVYLQNHLKPHPRDKYPKREFRKLRFEAFENEKIKNEVLKTINPLLDKYCSADNRTIDGR
ncbi:MAG: hypothetical protein JXL97_19190 [Bacteroidales bacterium]|nr:hypothetical protein [Bacteroidales bacterium]